MTATVTLYYKTGFNVTNIPDSPNRLNTSGIVSRNFESNYELQDNYIRSCIIEATWDDVKNADYLKLNNTYFFIVSASMLNENVAELAIQLDALTTLGGPASLTYSGGIINRAHALSDDLFANCIEEDITPHKPLILAHDTAIGPESGNDYNTITIIGSTLSLLEPAVMLDTNGKIHYVDPTRTEYAFTFKGTLGTEDYTVTLPQSPPLADESYVTVDNKRAVISGVGLYVGCEANIQYLRMLNLDGALLYCYKLPYNIGGTNYVNIVDRDGHTPAQGLSGQVDLTGNNVINNTSAPAFVRSDYTARNNKVYAMYNTMRLVYELSGDEQIYNMADLYVSGATRPEIRTVTDPQPGGCFISYPATYMTRGMRMNQKSVKSAKWKNTPISFNIPGGSAYADNEYGLAKNKLRQDYYNEYGIGGSVNSVMQGAQGGSALGGVNGALLGGIMGGTGALGKSIGELIQGGRHYTNPLNELKYNYQKSKIITPDLTCTPCTGLVNVRPDSLIIQEIAPAVSDLQLFDKYFDYYGYKQGGIAFDKAYLSGRQYCNYIECSDVHITSDDNDFGLAVKVEAERQLNDGVRIWHTKPFALTSNPIV